MARIVVDTREPDGMLRTFWPQLGRMRRATRFAYLMLEGGSLDNGPIAPAAIRGVCVAAMDLGVQIVRSEDLRDSAQWLHRLAERRASGAYRSPLRTHSDRDERSASMQLSRLSPRFPAHRR
jgi:ERCC4-type nuclease